VWVPTVLSYRARHLMSLLPEDLTPVPTRYWKPPGVAVGSRGVPRAELRGRVVTSVPQYPGYKTLTVAPGLSLSEWPEPFTQRGGGQNKYSHVTMGTITGSSHDPGASWYDRSCDVQPKSRSTTRVRIYGRRQDVSAL
jgi:hypothetical protein